MRARRILLIGGLAVALLGGLGWGAYAVSRARCFTLAGPVVCRVETAAPRVAVTFDDGPTAAGLDAVLPELERRGVHATFFLIGRDIARRPDLARRLVAGGHEIGNHTFSHRRMVFHGPAFYDREIRETERLLRAAGGRSALFRPPYGKKLIGLPQAVGRAGLIMVTWDVEDPPTDDPAEFARRVVAQARPGSIILVHPMYAGNATARAALPLILDGLAAKGLKVGTVGELLRATAPSAGP